jgi:hypothetical protein
VRLRAARHLLPLTALLLPAPALADVTATYMAGNATLASGAFAAALTPPPRWGLNAVKDRARPYEADATPERAPPAPE